jgi:cytochrome d ubiquinol oxidase subunit I
MVGIGTLLVLLGLWGLVLRLRRRDPAGARWFLRATLLSGIGAVVALESGWIVTEVGRQPWIVYLIQRTSEAVTSSGGVRLSFAVVLALYTGLGVVSLMILRTMARRWATADARAGGRAVEALDREAAVPYGPRRDAGDEPTGGLR